MPWGQWCSGRLSAQHSSSFDPSSPVLRWCNCAGVPGQQLRRLERPLLHVSGALHLSLRGPGCCHVRCSWACHPVCQTQSEHPPSCNPHKPLCWCSAGVPESTRSCGGSRGRCRAGARRCPGPCAGAGSCHLPCRVPHDAAASQHRRAAGARRRRSVRAAVLMPFAVTHVWQGSSIY